MKKVLIVEDERIACHNLGQFMLKKGYSSTCAYTFTEAKEQIGALETVVVKQAIGHFSAECLPPEVSQKLIQKAAQRAVKKLIKKNTPKPFVLKTPVTMMVELNSSDMADKAMLMPGVTRSGLKLSFTAEDMPAAYSAFRALVLMSYPR